MTDAEQYWKNCFECCKDKPSSSCYEEFMLDRDEDMSLDDFHSLCKALFCDESGNPYSLNTEQVQEMFSIFDKNEDGVIDKSEFDFCWNNWIKTIIRPVSAFIIVDVQNDFITGSLALKNFSAGQEATEVIDPINNLLDSVQFDAVVYTYDWHPENHISFFENLHKYKLDASSPVKAEDAKLFDTVVFEGPPPTKQILWRKHCVKDTWGADLHIDLKVVEGAIKIYKGVNAHVDSYSAIWDNNRQSQTDLYAQLQKRNITDVYICGIAYDICVASTAGHMQELGYRTILIEDCCRGVDLFDIEYNKKKISEDNGIFVDSAKVKAMVAGMDRRPELGYKLARELKKTTLSCCCG